MKVEQNKVELAARLFFSKDALDAVTNEILADKLPEVKLYRQFTSENNRNAELNMYLNGNGKGWVILSSDTNLPAVWADTDEEITEMGDCPPFEMLMEMYLEGMEIMLAKVESSAGRNDEESVAFMETIAANQNEWERLLAGEIRQRPSSSGTTNDPNGRTYLVTSSWKQDGYYNNHVNEYCQRLKPVEDEYIVGCGAVALAQILRQRAKANNKKIAFQGNVKYRWEKAGKDIDYSFGSANQYTPTVQADVIWAWTSWKETNEVTNCLRDVALMIKSNFGTDATGSNIHNSAAAIKNHISGGNHGSIIQAQPAFWQLLKECVGLRECPVLVRGTHVKTSDGHAFVIDGVDGAYYHFNMGWGVNRLCVESIFWGRESEFCKGMEAVLDIEVENQRQPAPRYTAGGDTMNTNLSLFAGDRIRSQNGKFTAIMQDDGNFVVYKGTSYSPKDALWHSKTHNFPGAYFEFQTDGNLVVYKKPPSATPLWSPYIHGKGATKLVMQNDGNLVAYTSSDKPVWASGI